MPKILNEEDQRAALREIKAILKNLTGINKFLEAENPEGIYKISFSIGTEIYNAQLAAEHKEDIDFFVNAYKTKLRDHILELAQLYNIGFDADEQETLGLIE